MTRQKSAYMTAVDEERAAWQAFKACPPSEVSASVELYRRWRDAVDRTIVEIERVAGDAWRAQQPEQGKSQGEMQ